MLVRTFSVADDTKLSTRFEPKFYWSEDERANHCSIPPPVLHINSVNNLLIKYYSPLTKTSRRLYKCDQDCENVDSIWHAKSTTCTCMLSISHSLSLSPTVERRCTVHCCRCMLAPNGGAKRCCGLFSRRIVIIFDIITVNSGKKNVNSLWPFTLTLVISTDRGLHLQNLPLVEFINQLTGQTNRQTDKQLDRQTNERTGGRTGGWTDGLFLNSALSGLLFSVYVY